MGRRIRGFFSLLILIILLLLSSSSCVGPLRDQIELFANGYSAIIEDEVVYVSVLKGNDENPGTKTDPKKPSKAPLTLQAN